MRAYVHAEHRFHLHRREISTTGQKFVRPRRQVYQTVPKGNLKGRGPKRWSEGSAIFFRKRESLVSLEGLKLRLESRRRDTHGNPRVQRPLLRELLKISPPFRVQRLSRLLSFFLF